MNNNEIWGIILDAISVVIGVQNLYENREQSAQNDIAKHNQEQAKFILNDLHERLDYQNNLLEEILKILKGDKKI